MTTIKTFSDGSIIEIGQGKFDPHCVFVTRPGRTKIAPTDYGYFLELMTYTNVHSQQDLYNDLVDIFNLTTNTIDPAVLNHIDSISQKYGNEALDIAIIFTTIYLGMIAEENKANTRLGKRIKRHGFHKLLVNNDSVSNSAHSSRGKTWRQIDTDCQSWGF